MTCLFDHNWGWPRKRGAKDIQVCLNCGHERESKVRFDGPHYRRTQGPIPDSTPAALHIQPDDRSVEFPGLLAAA